MKLKVDIALKTIDGLPMREMKQDNTFIDITVRHVCIEALLRPTQERLTGEDKLVRWNMAQRIHAAVDEVELDKSEVEMIKKIIGDLFTVQVVGQMASILR